MDKEAIIEQLNETADQCYELAKECRRDGTEAQANYWNGKENAYRDAVNLIRNA